MQPGCSAATACALCGGLQLRERRLDLEQRRLAQLAQRALAFTPQVSVEPEHATLLLDLAGCLRLFRGLAALTARIDAFLAREQVTAQRAFAHTPLAARLFAVHGTDTRRFFDDDGLADTRALRAALAALPLDSLGLDTRTEESLMQMGFRQFGDIDTLPRQALGRRFGAGFIGWLDRVTGARPDPRTAVQPATFYVREVNFLDGIVHTAGLAFPMQRLLGDFAQHLRRHQLATQQITWRLTHVDGSTQEIAVHTSRPETAPAPLLALTRVHLESTRLPAPVETLRLACRRFVPLAAPDRAGRLFTTPEDGTDTGHVDALVDRLRARLGDAHCRQFSALDSWVPETAQRAVSLTAPAQRAAHAIRVTLRDPPPPAPANDEGARLRRPLWLLREPLRIDHHAGQLRWHGVLQILEGPERLDCAWWSQPVLRDYFIAQHEAGTRCWIFHDRAQDAWFVHGVFG